MVHIWYTLDTQLSTHIPAQPSHLVVFQGVYKAGELYSGVQGHKPGGAVVKTPAGIKRRVCEGGVSGGYATNIQCGVCKRWTKHQGMAVHNVRSSFLAREEVREPTLFKFCV